MTEKKKKKKPTFERKKTPKKKKSSFFFLSLSLTHTHTQKQSTSARRASGPPSGAPTPRSETGFTNTRIGCIRREVRVFLKVFFRVFLFLSFSSQPPPSKKKKKKKPTQVFVSRTFGGLLRLSRAQLWLLPSFQVLLLALFVAAGASSRRWMELSPALLPFPLLLAPALAVGLLGGLGYVSTFTLLADCVPFPPLRQVSLAAVSVADSAGIALADAASVLVQGCLFRAAGIPGAAFKCGWRGGGEGGR